MKTEINEQEEYRLKHGMEAWKEKYGQKVEDIITETPAIKVPLVVDTIKSMVKAGITTERIAGWLNISLKEVMVVVDGGGSLEDEQDWEHEYTCESEEKYITSITRNGVKIGGRFFHDFWMDAQLGRKVYIDEVVGVEEGTQDAIIYSIDGNYLGIARIVTPVAENKKDEIEASSILQHWQNQFINFNNGPHAGKTTNLKTSFRLSASTGFSNPPFPYGYCNPLAMPQSMWKYWNEEQKEFVKNNEHITSSVNFRIVRDLDLFKQLIENGATYGEIATLFFVTEEKIEEVYAKHILG